MKTSVAAELQVVHTVGMEGMDTVTTPELAIIQYCLLSANGSQEQWYALWKKARLVWSYYNIQMPEGVRFYHAPLGVDGEMFRAAEGSRPIGVITSGYVSGPAAEAIEEVAEAALREKLSVVHIGPSGVAGMKKRCEPTWKAQQGMTDAALSILYGRARWVSGLRHVEGFELPALEGLVCGARPIVFDRPDMREWYDGLAVFIPECSGAELVRELRAVFSLSPAPVTAEERARVLARFDWTTVTTGFWERLLA
jgi:hypothetical protein